MSLGAASYAKILCSGVFVSGREEDEIKRNSASFLMTAKSGEVVRRLFADNLALQRADLDVGGGTVAIERKPDAPLGIGRIGFSIANDGVIDAWLTRDTKTGLNKVEISTKRNGSIDRWEYYDKNVLVRVELDTNRNGKADRWMTYQDGIQMETILDVNEDGEPDS
ncbi:MAG: hypothetical protein ACKOEC_11210 [Acidimicrobiia bacterium]